MRAIPSYLLAERHIYTQTELTHALATERARLRALVEVLAYYAKREERGK